MLIVVLLIIVFVVLITLLNCFVERCRQRDSQNADKEIDSDDDYVPDGKEDDSNRNKNTDRAKEDTSQLDRIPSSGSSNRVHHFPNQS